MECISIKPSESPSNVLSQPLLVPTSDWILKVLRDPQVTDFCLNGPTSAYLDRGEGFEKVQIPQVERSGDHRLFQEWVLSLLSSIGKTWDAKNPFVDAMLPSGFRVHIVFPPLSPQGILVSFRRLPGSIPALSLSPLDPSGNDSAQARWKDSPLYSQAVRMVQNGNSVLISGATGSGKTTLATDLISEIPISERIIALEDTPELYPRHPHFISLVSRPPNADGYGEVTLRSLLKQTLRMRPDRIILGECRGSEVLELLQTLNTGQRGAMATLHANSARDALRRVELLCLLASPGSLSGSTIRDLLCAGIHSIIQVKRVGSIRKISEIWNLEGREGDIILMRPMVGSGLRQSPRTEVRGLKGNLRAQIDQTKKGEI